MADLHEIFGLRAIGVYLWIAMLTVFDANKSPVPGTDLDGLRS